MAVMFSFILLALLLQLRLASSGKFVTLISSFNHSNVTLIQQCSIAVENGPKIAPFAFANVLQEGDDAAVNCVVSSDSELTIKWFRNGLEIGTEGSGRVTIGSLGKKMSTLLITKVTISDNGNYTCIATTSSSRSDSYTANLVVSSKPKWLIEPKNAHVSKGQKATFDCIAIASPPARTSWLFDSVNSKL